MDERPTTPQATRNVRDAATMRALSHPARWAILQHLGLGKPATATELAEVSQLSPSATSYHLRELAKTNLIEEAPSRGDGRERLWQTAVRGLDIHAGPNSTAEEQAAERGVSELFLEIDQARARVWLDQRVHESEEWYEASAMSSMRLVLTAQELKDLAQQVHALLFPYGISSRPEPPAGARIVYANFHAWPAPPSD